jgi:hypothetical protein
MQGLSAECRIDGSAARCVLYWRQPQSSFRGSSPGSQADRGAAASWRMRSSTSAGSTRRLGLLSLLPAARLAVSSTARAAALKASGQWWWVAGLQPRARDTSLQQAEETIVHPSAARCAPGCRMHTCALAAIGCLAWGSVLGCGSQRDQTRRAPRCHGQGTVGAPHCATRRGGSRRPGAPR